MANKSKSGWIKWPVALLVLVCAGWAVWHFTHRGDSAPQYQTATISRGDMTQVVTATGQLNPVLNVQVGSQISGIIQKLYADFNSSVTSNQVIAQLDPATYRASVHQAEGELANAKSSLELAQLNARRAGELHANNLISKADHDKSVIDLHQAEATVKIREAALEKANVDLSRCTIYAPVDGVVISRSVDVGQTVAASLSAPTIFVIANDLTKMQIDANVAEADVGGIENGQDVNFTVDAYPSRTFRGTVRQVRNAPIIVASVVTYDTVIAVDNPDYKLKPGMTANASVIIAARENVLKIPNAALRFRPPTTVAAPAKTNAPSTPATQSTGGSNRQGKRGGSGGGGSGRNEQQMTRTVYTISGDGNDAKLNPVQIKVGITDGILTEVLDGLKEGDQIVTGSSMANKQTAAPAASPFGGGFQRRF